MLNKPLQRTRPLPPSMPISCQLSSVLVHSFSNWWTLPTGHKVPWRHQLITKGRWMSSSEIWLHALKPRFHSCSMILLPDMLPGAPPKMVRGPNALDGHAAAGPLSSGMSCRSQAPPLALRICRDSVLGHINYIFLVASCCLCFLPILLLPSACF